MNTWTGWLLDLYPHPQKGIVLWLTGEDGKARNFFDPGFEVSFYAGGDVARLRQFWQWLKTRKLKLQYTRREDLFTGVQDVVEVRSSNPAGFPELFRGIQNRFPELVYYNADIPMSLRFLSAHRLFMMAHCKVQAQADGTLEHIHTDDSPETLDPALPNLRRLHIKPDANPATAHPSMLAIKYEGFRIRAPLDRPRDLLGLVREIINEYDPDVILTRFGDTWLFDHLERIAQQSSSPFNPNRDTSMPLVRRQETTFFNYGRAHYRGAQVHLRGRWHVDEYNGMTYNDYGLAGAIEETRMTSLPLQEAARRSPGAGISALQVMTALQRGVLIPYQHQKGELAKSFNHMVKADRGGLIMQPPVGIFQNVGLLDFSSMMASIMIEFNVSPETAGADDPDALEIPELGIRIGTRPGLMPAALRPLRDKRLALKHKIKGLDKQAPDYSTVRRRYKAVVDALKWLTVVAYGRLGFANSIFGRINSHEVVSYLSRQAVTRAKLVAEEQGFRVLHLYVDSLFVSRPGATPKDFQALAQAIEQETRLPIELQNIYPWFAFLGTRENPRISVANRFYGLAPNGDHKIRGVALRRSDTPRFIANMQMRVLETLAREPDASKLSGRLPEILQLIRAQLSALRAGQIPIADLVVTQTLSRELTDYSYFSPAATAAKQLEASGRRLRMGQRVRYLMITTSPGACVWDLADNLDPRTIDASRYKELVLRAMHEILQPLGTTESMLRSWLFSGAGYIAPANMNAGSEEPEIHMPLFPSSLPRSFIPPT